MANGEFVPTHVVPADGLPAWTTPDGEFPPITTLTAGLPVSVFQRQDAWARVATRDGWTGWLDGNRLVQLGSAPPTAAPPPPPPAPPPPPSTATTPTGRVEPVNVALGAAVLSLIGSLLPWSFIDGNAIVGLGSEWAPWAFLAGLFALGFAVSVRRGADVEKSTRLVGVGAVICFIGLAGLTEEGGVGVAPFVEIIAAVGLIGAGLRLRRMARLAVDRP